VTTRTPTLGMFIVVLAGSSLALSGAVIGEPRINGSDSNWRHSMMAADLTNGGNTPKMYKNDKHASVAAFVLVALEFFQEVERDEKLASRYLDLGLGPAVSWKGDIDLAVSKGDLEGLKDIQEQFLEMAMLLSAVQLAELNERVKRASGVDFETYNAAFLGRVEEMLAQGTVGSAEDYRDLERYLFRLQGSEPPEQPSERQLAVERLMDAFDTFDVVEDETVIIKRGEEILARQTIRSPEEFAALDAYRNHLIDSQDTSGREWDAEELLGKHARFDKPF